MGSVPGGPAGVPAGKKSNRNVSLGSCPPVLRPGEDAWGCTALAVVLLVSLPLPRCPLPLSLPSLPSPPSSPSPCSPLPFPSTLPLLSFPLLPLPCPLLPLTRGSSPVAVEVGCCWLPLLTRDFFWGGGEEQQALKEGKAKTTASTRARRRLSVGQWGEHRPEWVTEFEG